MNEDDWAKIYSRYTKVRNTIVIDEIASPPKLYSLCHCDHNKQTHRVSYISSGCVGYNKSCKCRIFYPKELSETTWVWLNSMIKNHTPLCKLVNHYLNRNRS